MTKKDLYKYNNPNGGVTVSPNKPECEYTPMIRLIADEGKAITKTGEEHWTCLDIEVDEESEYSEIDYVDEEIEAMKEK